MADLEGIRGTGELLGRSVTGRIVEVDSRHNTAPFNAATARALVDATLDALRDLPLWAGAEQSRSDDWAQLVEEAVRGIERWSLHLGRKERAQLGAAMHWSSPIVEWRVEAVTAGASGLPPAIDDSRDPIVRAAFSSEHGPDPSAIALLRAAYAAELVAPGRHRLTPVLALNMMGAILANGPDGPELLRWGQRIPLQWDTNLFTAAAPARLRPVEAEVASPSL